MNAQVTIDDLIKPRTQSERILAKLKEAGQYGVSNRDLNNICYRFSARIHDLRRQGYNIKGTQIARGYWKFHLVNE